jgi:hypothetical protein
MIAVARFRLTSLLQSQRYLAPVLTFLAVAAIFASGDSGPALSTYAPLSGTTFVCSAWLTITLLGLDDATIRDVMIVSSGGSRLRVVTASALLAAALSLMMGVVAAALPMMSTQFTPATLRSGALSAVVCALAGVGGGMLCSRLVIPRPGYGLVAAALVAFALIRLDVPPVGLLLQQLSRLHPPRDLAVDITGDLTIAVLMVALGVAVGTYVDSRRS